MNQAIKKQFDQDAIERRVIRNAFEIKSAEMDDRGVLKGASSVLGRLDRGSDCIFPGFFRKAIPGFKQHGFIPISHDWGGLPVAMPTVAEERGNQLYTEAVFHSTQSGQDARTVAKERMEAGLSVGLSVGYMPDYDTGVKLFETGAAMLKHAQELGCDMALFDTKQIKAHKDWCRALLPDGCVELFEYSMTSVPMNQLALAAEAKSAASLPVEVKEWYWREDEDFDPWDDATEDATISALDRYHWAMWRCMVRCVRADDTDISERVTELSGHFDTCRDKSIAVIRALSELDEEAKSAMIDALQVVTARLAPSADTVAPKPELKAASEIIADLAKKHTDIRAFERSLRDAGVSRTQSPALAAAYFKAEPGTAATQTTEEQGDPVTPGDDTHEIDTARLRAARLRDLRLRHMALDMTKREVLEGSLHHGTAAH